jgi:hypothetical protein
MVVATQRLDGRQDLVLFHGAERPAAAVQRSELRQVGRFAF